MAETPFTPDSGAAPSGTAPEDGTPGTPVESSADSTALPEPAAVTEVAAEPQPPVAAPAPAPVAPEPAAEAESSIPAAAAESVAAPAAEPVAEPASQPPGVAATIAVPPLEQAEAGGGEWELLVERFNTWWNSGELNRQWQRIRGPLKGVAILVAVLLALQVYATVVGTIDSIPLVSGLLELTGLIVALQFSYRRLLRSSDRQQVFEQLQRRWLDFRGRG